MITRFDKQWNTYYYGEFALEHQIDDNHTISLNVIYNDGKLLFISQEMSVLWNSSIVISSSSTPLKIKSGSEEVLMLACGLY